MNDNKIVAEITFSFTDDYNETTCLHKTFSENDDIGKIDWLLDEFKYFLLAMSFSEDMTDRIVYLDVGDKVIDKDGYDVTNERI